MEALRGHYFYSIQKSENIFSRFKKVKIFEKKWKHFYSVQDVKIFLLQKSENILTLQKSKNILLKNVKNI